MTRGKNAAKTLNRERAAADREAPLRRRIAQLEKQVEDLELSNLAQQAAHNNATRNMRILIAANTSEALEQARQELTTLRRDFETSERARKVMNGSILRLGNALQDEYQAQGMKLIDAREAVLKVTKYIGSYISDTIPGFIKVDDINTTAGVANASSKGLFEADADPEEVIKMHRLQRAKGMRG